MKKFVSFIIISVAFISCNNNSTQQQQQTTANTNEASIQGTWKLISGTTITKNDTDVTDYLHGKSFIKIINDTHFSFLGHDLDKGKDTANAFFSSGGGTYELHDSNYTEHLEYCNAREWEGNSFNMTVQISSDTLVQTGIEKIDSIGVNRINIEKYVRLK